jgi:hypothetical protein
MTLVSLGGNCAVTYHLIKHNKRFSAYPFDWSKISLYQLISVLENNFSGYSDELFIKKLSTMHLDNLDRPTLMIMNRYNITFAHEILDKQDLIGFSQSLERRIQRFRELDNPIFIRLETFSIKDLTIYDKLITILDKWFVQYEFILISKEKPDNNKINWIQLDDYSPNWKYENVDWSFLNL